MPRKCNDCRYEFEGQADRCPKCGGYTAIVCRSGGNAGPDDDPRRGVWAPRPMSRSAQYEARTWLMPGLVIIAILVAVLLYAGSRGATARVQPREEPVNSGARISLGMPVRDAVLALEPEPNPNRRVTLHDLLKPDAPKSGQFTYTDNNRMTVVTFRNGKVTGVNETRYPGGFGGYMPEAVNITITTTDGDAPSPDPEDQP